MTDENEKQIIKRRRITKEEEDENENVRSSSLTVPVAATLSSSSSSFSTTSAVAINNTNNNAKVNLHSLIEQGQWQDLIDIVKELRNTSRTTTTTTAIGNNNDDSSKHNIPALHGRNHLGLTPLQAVLEVVGPSNDDVPSDVIRVLADQGTVAYDTHPFLCTVLERTICSSAIKGTDAKEECIRHVLSYHPAAIVLPVQSAPPNSHWTIFHILLHNQQTACCSLRLMEDMVQVYVNEFKDGNEEQQLQTTEDGWEHIAQHVDNHGMLLLHYALQEHAPSDVILRLFHANPNGALVRPNSSTNMTTLDMAVYHGCSFDVLRTLVDYAPEMIGNNRMTSSNRGRHNKKKKYIYKNTPLHLLFHTDVKQRWIARRTNTTTTNSGSTDNGRIMEVCMPPWKMAWYLIVRHAHHMRDSIGAGCSKRTKANAAQIAYKLVFQTRGEGNCTVHDRMEELSDNLERDANVYSGDVQEFKKFYREDIRQGIMWYKPFPPEVIMDFSL